MIVPYRPVTLKKSTRKFRYIIIHDSSCRFSNLGFAKVDGKKSSISKMRGYNWVFNGEFELPYHFVCERIGKDFETLMATPFSYRCIYDDIPFEFEASIHIAIAGDYSIIQPNQRAYQQIGYRSMASIMRWFSIPFGHIFFHHEISTDKSLKCPGPLFDKSRLMAAIKPMILMKA